MATLLSVQMKARFRLEPAIQILITQLMLLETQRDGMRSWSTHQMASIWLSEVTIKKQGFMMWIIIINVSLYAKVIVLTSIAWIGVLIVKQLELFAVLTNFSILLKMVCNKPLELQLTKTNFGPLKQPNLAGTLTVFIHQESMVPMSTVLIVHQTNNLLLPQLTTERSTFSETLAVWDLCQKSM